MDPSTGGGVDLRSLLPDAPFQELHSRTIDAPIDVVWPAFLGLPADQIRLLKPLFVLRSLPAQLRRQRTVTPGGSRAALELFSDEGFVMLREQAEPIDGHAQLIFGAAGKFWSPAHNGPLDFESADDFLAFTTPGNAKTVARFEAFSEGDRTRLETETIVSVTDPASKPKFAAYWTIIRGPSGLLRRSWLAGVDRYATARP